MTTNLKMQHSTARKFASSSLVLALLLAAAVPVISADDRKSKTIDAQAMGTSTQMGRNVAVKARVW